MPAKNRSKRLAIIERLHIEPTAFDFFSAVSILLSQFKPAETSSQIIGESIRFASSTSLAFPYAQIAAIQKIESSNEPNSQSLELAAPVSSEHQAEQAAFVEPTIQYVITPSLIGLTGPLGALPNIYSQYLQDQSIKHRTNEAGAFLDVFNNRLISLYVRAHFELNLTHTYGLTTQNRYGQLIKSLTFKLSDASKKDPEIKEKSDAAFAALTGREIVVNPLTALPEEFLIAFSGLFRQRMVSAQSLQQLLQGYLQVPIRVEQFEPAWFWFAEDEKSRLGQESAMLGTSIFLGDRTQQVDSQISIYIGPVHRQTYFDLLPKGNLYKALTTLLSQVCSPSISVILKPILHRDDVQPMRLGHSDSVLGQQSYLLTKQPQSHRQDIELTCDLLQVS